MMSTDRFATPHHHVFLGENHSRNEKRTWLVILITTTMMVLEIAVGTLSGSMALVADGWHMSTHAGAMLITAFAYRFARTHADDRRFSFGTGKLGDLAGFASAVVLGIIALLIGWESLMRLYSPVAIDFSQAIGVAVLGLAVNLFCAWLLRDDPDHHHGHDHQSHGHHDHDHDHHAGDNNLRAAYLHVLADAMTSVLAIIALVLGSLYGLNWMDPAMGILGGLVIARWSIGLIRGTGAALLDYIPEGEDLPEEIRAAIESPQDQIADLHIWKLGPGHMAASLVIESQAPQPLEVYRAKLAQIHDLSHLTIEIQPV